MPREFKAFAVGFLFGVTVTAGAAAAAFYTIKSRDLSLENFWSSSTPRTFPGPAVKHTFTPEERDPNYWTEERKRSANPG
ncbi:hypothetical protein HDA32_001820 [Spinactinospora alkalitolerans]|uniref:Uncharacterized protein n=1 Tax=Spinactinospora alkalitolerans TaxID=687207 RepID=A0A852TXW9_9ACTN|nr:hypothetical protein [Spinactinospora alkalitolerans]NYE46700.1 hypothetical protein [Spinactinospora alkalitolerans]